MKTNAKSRYRNHAPRGISLKAWAHEQVARRTDHADPCLTWLTNKGQRPSWA